VTRVAGCAHVSPLVHPGPRAAHRRTSVPVRSRAVFLSLPPGRRLVDALDSALADLEVTSAQVELLDGTLSRLSYCYPAPPGDRPAAVWFSDTVEARAPARLLAGSMTVGTRDGERYFHCHAAWVDAAGELRGGHVWPETMVGPGPLHVLVHALDGVDSRSAVDPETTLPVFTPHARSLSAPAAGDVRRAVMSRLHPGVDVTAAVAEIAAEHGFTAGSVSGSVGSLVGVVLQGPDGPVVVEGPATEVSFAGVVPAPGRGSPTVSVIAVDGRAQVHAGLLVPGENLVAVTVELLVEEVID
jgi:predicted DNA-binding protein with PD1-like motif